MEVEIKNASKSIKGTLVLSNINIKLHSGKIYCIQGPNGSGKTMLLRLIAGLIRPTSGYVLINGDQLGKGFDFPESIGMMIENPAFLPNYTGLVNLKLLASIQNKISDEQICKILFKVGLTPSDKRKYRKYSLGMKQRLGIAAAIMEEPDLILLDEPTNALDQQGIEEICTLIQKERNRGALIIIASHDAAFVERIADEVYSVHEGTINYSVS